MPHSDPETKRLYHRDYKRANRWRYRKRAKAYDAAVHANRRAAAFGVLGTITAEDVEAIFAAGQCHYCAGSEHLELDHVIPMDKGGPNVVTNIVAACHSCNDSKARSDRPGRWSRGHDACLDCGTTTRPHVAHGRCNACHLRLFGARARQRAAREGLPSPRP